MVIRLLKNFIKVTTLVSTGALLAIWFAPPTAKTTLREKMTFAQRHGTKIQEKADKVWTSTLQKKLISAGKSLDPRKIDRKTVDGWILSGKQAVTTISDDAKRAQETLVKANEVIQKTRTEYRRYGTMFGM